jgi:hypothetical protein
MSSMPPLMLGGDMTDTLDLTQARRPGQERQRVAIDLPSWVVDSLDREAKRLGVSRQTVIRPWITERLERRSA